MNVNIGTYIFTKYASVYYVLSTYLLSWVEIYKSSILFTLEGNYKSRSLYSNNIFIRGLEVEIGDVFQGLLQFVASLRAPNYPGLI